MLSKGLRDEENEKINRLFNEALDIEFVPELWRKQQREVVNGVLIQASGFDLSELLDIENKELFDKLRQRKVSFSNCEQLGDLLMEILPLEKEESRLKLTQKAIAVYEFTQQESKTFSISLFQKMNAAKAQMEKLK